MAFESERFLLIRENQNNIKRVNVLTVEEDRDVLGLAIQNTQSPTPSWGLDRVDQRDKVGLPGSTSAYGYRSAGTGAHRSDADRCKGGQYGWC